jgi:hypothetical protein
MPAVNNPLHTQYTNNGNSDAFSILQRCEYMNHCAGASLMRRIRRSREDELVLDEPPVGKLRACVVDKLAVFHGIKYRTRCNVAECKIREISTVTEALTYSHFLEIRSEECVQGGGGVDVMGRDDKLLKYLVDEIGERRKHGVP